jgi:hypothetical protein
MDIGNYIYLCTTCFKIPYLRIFPTLYLLVTYDSQNFFVRHEPIDLSNEDVFSLRYGLSVHIYIYIYIYIYASCLKVFNEV